MRRILIGAGIAAVVVILGLFIAVSLIDVNKFRPQIQAQIQKAIHRDVTLGNMSLKLFPLAVKVESLSVSEDPSFKSGRPFATAHDVAVSAGLFSILRGSPEVKSISLSKPQVELIRNAAGNWNFSSMTKSDNKESNSELSLNSLKIDDGQVGYTDAMQNMPRTVYDHIDMKLTDYAPNKRFGLDLDVHFPGSGKQLLSLNSKIGPIPQTGSAASTPVDGKVSLEEVTLSGISKFAAGALPPNTDGTASGEATLKSDNDSLSAEGNLKLTNTTVKGSKIDYPIEATFNLADNRKTDVINVKSGDLKLGSTPFSMSGTIDNGKKPAVLDVKLGTKNASITDLAKLAGSFGVAFNPSYQVKGQLTADISAKGPTSAPQLSGKISGRELSASGGEIKQPVQISALDLTLSPDSIISNPFTAQSGSTRVDANFTATNYNAKNTSVDASLKTENADIAELVNMAKAYGVDAAKGMSGTGRLSLNVHVQGPVSDTAKLNYAGSGAISAATLTAPAVLTKPVSVASANLTFAQNSASISNLAMTVGGTSVKGNLSAKNLAAPQLSFQLAADKINTAELQQLTATPAKPAAPSTPAATAKEPSILSKTTGGGTLSAGTVVADDFTLTNVKATVKLANGLITLSPLTAGLYGGQENGTITLDTRPATTLCSVNAKLSGVDANALLGAVSSAKDTLYGSLAATSNLTFALLPAGELPKTLNGTLAFDVANGELKRVNILNEISRIAKFLNPSQAAGSSGNATKLTKLSGSMNLRNGEGTTNDLVAAIQGGSLSGKGTVNLASQALNMDVNAVLASGVTSAVGGTNVGGFLNTALANNKGELVVPVKVGGTLQKPVITPDASAMAQMKLKNLLPTTGNPAAGVAGAILGGKGGGAKGILNGITGGGKSQDPNQQQQQQQQQKPEDAIKGILKGFGKKKQ